MLVSLFALGLLLWPLVEYGIHGFLSHRLRTPVSGLHWVHHVQPERVFTSALAWIPAIALLFSATSLALGTGRAGALVFGLLLGFWRYEYVHWRIHFRAPRNDRAPRPDTYRLPEGVTKDRAADH